VAYVLANLPGYLVRDGLAHLPCNIMAGLSRDLDGNLTSNLVTFFSWHGGAFLLGNGGALLLGDGGALLLGHAVALLLWNIVADGLRNSPGGVDTLGLWDLSAPWAGNQAGLLDRPLVADAPDLGLAPWCSMCNGGNSSSDGGNDVLGISFGLSISLTFA